jgi:hypothetical protein
MMETIIASETSVNFCQNIRRDNLEDSHRQNSKHVAKEDETEFLIKYLEFHCLSWNKTRILSILKLSTVYAMHVESISGLIYGLFVSYKMAVL